MKHIFLFLVLLFVSSCGRQIKDFVNGSPKNPNSPKPPPVAGNSNSNGIRVTPGANKVAGSQVNAQFAITTMNRNISGSQVRAKISFQQTRTQ